MRNRLLLVALLVASSFITGLSFRPTPAPTFEYKFEEAPTEKRANALAADGWELVAIESQGPKRIVPTYVFKRLK
jgi:hypothetical protein